MARDGAAQMERRRAPGGAAFLCGEAMAFYYGEEMGR